MCLERRREQVDNADARERQAPRGAQVGEADLLAARDAHERAGRRLAEQRDERVGAFGQDDPHAGVATQAGLDERLRQPALGKVVRRIDQAVVGGVDQDVGQQLLAGQVDGRR